MKDGTCLTVLWRWWAGARREKRAGFFDGRLVPIFARERFVRTPLYIRIFAVAGDPADIRHVKKSNGSGLGVVFRTVQFDPLKTQPIG